MDDMEKCVKCGLKCCCILYFDQPATVHLRWIISTFQLVMFQAPRQNLRGVKGLMLFATNELGNNQNLDFGIINSGMAIFAPHSMQGFQ